MSPAEEKRLELIRKRQAGFTGLAERTKDFIIRQTINKWKEYSEITDILPNELYKINKQGDILKVIIPIPWLVYDEGKFEVNEYTFIFTEELTREKKRKKC